MPAKTGEMAGRRRLRDLFPGAARAGMTLVEILVAMVVMSVGVLGMVGAFKYFNVAIQSAKTRSLANNIAQEKIEYLKNKSYYRVLVTTEPAPGDTNFPELNNGAGMLYDLAPNGQETVNVGGIDFIRRVYIHKVSENTDGNLQHVEWTNPDTGLKEIIVYVIWLERGEWRKLEVRNLRENPERVNKSASIQGAVEEDVTATAIEGAMVRVQENPSQYAQTDSGGDYSFLVEPGSYTLLATKRGYFPRTLPQFGLESGGLKPSQNFELVPMASGTITGTVIMRDHLVISQIVGSSVNASGQYQEWIEVYNPTTWTWTMASGLGTGDNEELHVAYQQGGAADPIIPDIDYRTAELPAGHYFLFANTGTITAYGVSLAADAVYDTDGNFSNADNLILTGNPSPAGTVYLGNAASEVLQDKVGWDATANGESEKKNAPEYEGTAIVQAVGLSEGEEYVRKVNSANAASGSGRCHDYNNNNSDFLIADPLAHAPRNSSVYEPCYSGTPAEGALVFADDLLSSPVNASASGGFNLASVSTGTWTVYLSSGLFFSSMTASGGAMSFVSSVGTVKLSSDAVYGFVSGRVTDVANAPLEDISVFSTGSLPAVTDADGRYTLSISSGLATVIANYRSQSPSYVELSSVSVDVRLGQVVKDVDFALYYGGRIRGRVTTNGVDPLPNIPVIGLKDGMEQGSGISDTEGYFTISGSGVSTGTYWVVPQLETGESCNPSSTTVVVEAGEIPFSSTFTVSDAFGYVTGTVKKSGSLITTGVLVYVTTDTLDAGDYPPDMTPAQRAGTSVWYAASSSALGRYTIAAKGGYTYNVYAWHTTWSNSLPSVVRQQSLGVALPPAETVEINFDW